MMLEPLLTWHSFSGAVRPITTGLLQEIYLAPRQAPWSIASTLAAMDAPWSKSFEIAPSETATAVESALRNLIFSTRKLSPDEVQLSNFPQSRARDHLDALKRLWILLEDNLPMDIATLKHVLNSQACDAVEPLPLIELPDDPFATNAERSLRDLLIKHHGSVPASSCTTWSSRASAIPRETTGATSLSHLQKHLLSQDITPIPNDGSLAFCGLRDIAEEAEFAAGLVQSLLIKDQAVSCAQVGLLVPDEAGYSEHLRRAFTQAGIPISGLEKIEPKRDLAGETLTNAMLSLRAPAPVMALASLYVSPLMPWPNEAGHQLASEVMQGRFEPGFTKNFRGNDARIFDILRKGVQSSDDLLLALDTLSSSLTGDEKWAEQVITFRRRIADLRSLVATAPNAVPEWEHLFRLTSPTSPVKSPPERYVEGTSIFNSSELPWRRVRHLIVLGFSGNRYPSTPSSNPFFLNSELALIYKHTGLRLNGQPDLLKFRLELFRRQLMSATETATFLVPYRTGDGKRVASSPGLSLVARTTVHDGDPDRLVRDIRAQDAKEWPLQNTAIPQRHGDIKNADSEDDMIFLDRDLTKLRTNYNGKVRSQSPSRLETLLVSPLAWFLNEVDAVDIPWMPEEFDVRLKGILAHEVLEFIFPEGKRLPTRQEIEENTTKFISSAIRRHAPFLQTSAWSVERETLTLEVKRAAENWRGALEAHGANVLANEVTLAGSFCGIPIAGRADCVLRLNDGQLLIVDYKKSGSNSRRNRMEAGWDLQLELYRSMLQHPGDGTSDKLLNLLSSKPPAIAYYLMNDGGILENGLSFDSPSEHFETIAGDISHAASSRLREQLNLVRSGAIKLNTISDKKYFTKEANLTPYALDASPLIAAFLLPAENEETSDE